MMIAPASRRFAGQRRLVRRDEPGKGQRAAGGRHVGGVNVVLERDRDTVQRTADASGAALAVALVGLLEGTRVHVQRRVQPIFVQPDAGQRLGHNVT